MLPEIMAHKIFRKVITFPS